MKNFFTFFLLLGCVQLSYAQTGSVALVPFSSGYTLPLGIENCNDNRLFIVQKTGQVIICNAQGNKTATPYLNISDRITTTGSEQGLLSLAFDPNYNSNGFFYVNYIDKSGNTQISRFTVSNANRNLADITSEKRLLQIVQPYSNHNGGCMRFGPDGFLYIAAGDGGSGGDPQNNAQNPASLLGKILRIDVNTNNTYNVPASNPFVNATGYRSEIWALGVRNPWRFSFDAVSGALIIADVGQDAWEEVNLQFVKNKGGENYGWRCYEGNHAYNTNTCGEMSDYVFPVYEYPHSDLTGDCSVTGGFVYRGKKYPALFGRYFCADYCSGIIRMLSVKNKEITEEDVFKGDAFAYTSFGEDRSHELFITNYATGGIYRVASSPTSAQAEKNNLVSMIVYPNPARGNFAITYKTRQAGECIVAVFDVTGRQIYSAKRKAVNGENSWQVFLPADVKGSCRVKITSSSGNTISHSILIR